jgi:hypothetical protein
LTGESLFWKWQPQLLVPILDAGISPSVSTGRLLAVLDFVWLFGGAGETSYVTGLAFE